MPKAHRKSTGEEEEDVPLHGATNEEEAKIYSNGLDDIIIQMGADVKDELFDAMKDAIIKYKEAIASMFPNMETANPNTVWMVVKDKVRLCICPQSQKNENTLECMVSDDKVPQAAEVLGKVEEVTQEERELIRELFDLLEVAHSHLAAACSTLSRLSSTLRTTQLMTILDAGIRLLIQIKTTAALKLCDTPKETGGLPDDPEERVELMMLPNPTARTIRDEKMNSPARLLAATWAYQVSNVFGKGSTQCKIQEAYRVQTKQLSACIIGRKYLGEQTRREDYLGMIKVHPHQRNPQLHQPQLSKNNNILFKQNTTQLNTFT